MMDILNYDNYSDDEDTHSNALANVTQCNTTSDLDNQIFFCVKLYIFSYPSILTYVLGAQKNRLTETVLLSTLNICFA